MLLSYSIDLMSSYCKERCKKRGYFTVRLTVGGAAPPGLTASICENVDPFSLEYDSLIVKMDFTQGEGIEFFLFFHRSRGTQYQGCRIVESAWEPKFCAWQSA